MYKFTKICLGFDDLGRQSDMSSPGCSHLWETKKYNNIQMYKNFCKLYGIILYFISYDMDHILSMIPYHINYAGRISSLPLGLPERPLFASERHEIPTMWTKATSLVNYFVPKKGDLIQCLIRVILYTYILSIL